jgi:Tol biopolymer transport system component
VDGYLQSNRSAAWSPDGRAIAYLSSRPNAPLSLVIQALDRGSTKVLQPLLSYFNTPTWTPDGSITVSGSDLKGRRAVYRIDQTTNEASAIVTSPSGRCDEWPSWSFEWSSARSSDAVR